VSGQAVPRSLLRNHGKGAARGAMASNEVRVAWTSYVQDARSGRRHIFRDHESRVICRINSIVDSDLLFLRNPDALASRLPRGTILDMEAVP